MGVFAAGQPLEDEARSRNIALDGVRVPSGPIGRASGLCCEACDLHATIHCSSTLATLAWKEANTVEWLSGRAGEA
jgi:hypothetical protein